MPHNRLTAAQFASCVEVRAKPIRKLHVPLEKDVQATILDYLATIGAYAIRCNSGAMTGEHKGKRRFVRFTNRVGCSDILACWHGRFVAIEVKRPGAHPTLPQMAFLADVRKHNGIAFVAHSLDEVREHLAGIVGVI